MDGIFENYLTARVDGRLLIAVECLSWLILYDIINSWTLRHQNYSLYGALPLCVARCHAALASRTPQRLKFPWQAQEVYLTLSLLVKSCQPCAICRRWYAAATLFKNALFSFQLSDLNRALKIQRHSCS